MVVRTIDDMVAAFGGLDDTLKLFDIGASALCNWRVRGIPDKRHYAIERELRVRGHSVDPSLFGYGSSLRTREPQPRRELITA